jgi:nucleoside-diphosphate-sugar epimerase
VDRKFIVAESDRILVTGAGGFIGARVVHMLLEYGFRNLRCFVRPSSATATLEKVIRDNGATRDVDIVSGDLVSSRDCITAAEGVSVVYHLAAGMGKSFAGVFMNSVLATRNLMDAYLDRGCPRRFVNVSSFSVYSNRKLRRGAVLDESCSLEDSHQRRNDAYGFGKLKQEQLVVEYGIRRDLRYVILRPGTVFGPGKPNLSGRVGIDTFGFFMHLGGSNLLPLTYVDNCAEAVVLAGLVPDIEGEVFNVVDDELLTSREFLRAYKRRLGWFPSLRVPYPAALALSALWEEYSRRSKGQMPPAFNRRRCAAEWKGNRFSNAKLRQRLDWEPRVGMRQAMREFLGQFPAKG